jgi:hypothetical protein
MIDLVSILEELVKTDISKTPAIVSMKALRDEIAKELGPTSGRMESIYRPKEIATHIVSEMKIDLSAEFVASDDFVKAVKLTAQLIGNMWDAVVPEFGEKAFLSIATRFELVKN